MSCSVVVCTRNRPQELEQCLESLRSLQHNSFQVVIVDNAPIGPATRLIAERWHASYVLEPAPGLSRARNRGVQACTGEIIAFIDDDARSDPGWLSGLEREFNDPSVMAVVGRTLPIAIETEAQKLCARMGGYDRGCENRTVFDRETPGWFESANFGGIGNGMNMAFRRQAFDVWAGFDPRLGRGAPIPGNEEHHAFFSLIARGYRVVYTPSAIVRHPFPATWNQFREKQLETLGCGFGYLAFLLRHEPRHRRELVRFTLRRLRNKAQNWRHAPIEYRRLVPLWRQVPQMVWCVLRSLVARAPSRADSTQLR